MGMVVSMGGGVNCVYVCGWGCDGRCECGWYVV